MSVDDKEIRKRLELIRQLISLEEESMIAGQVEKIQTTSLNQELLAIITALEVKSYANAMRMIDEFLRSDTQILAYENPELEGLRLEAKVIEKQLDELRLVKADIEKKFYEFNVRYQQELGDLMLQLLKLRQDQLREEAENDPDKEEKYQEAETDYKSYQQKHEEESKTTILDLNEEQADDLKDLYRKASKLCHPDRVTEEFKEQATAMFIRLKDAFDQNDIELVEALYAELRARNLEADQSDSISDKDQLKQYIQKLRMELQSLEKELGDLKTSEHYGVVVSDEWDAFFEENRAFVDSEIKRYSGN